jgi:hypothetical protein
MSLVQKNNFLESTIMKNSNKVNIFLAVGLIVMFLVWVNIPPVSIAVVEVAPKKEGYCGSCGKIA